MRTALLAICFVLKLLKRSSHHAPKIRRVPFNLLNILFLKKKVKFYFYATESKNSNSIRKDKC